MFLEFFCFYFCLEIKLMQIAEWTCDSEGNAATVGDKGAPILNNGNYYKTGQLQEKNQWLS
jgi:hypothetical protein